MFNLNSISFSFRSFPNAIVRKNCVRVCKEVFDKRDAQFHLSKSNVCACVREETLSAPTHTKEAIYIKLYQIAT